MRFVIENAHAIDPQLQAQYIALRAHEFKGVDDQTTYSARPNSWDIKKDTLYILAVDENERVRGGIQLLFHARGSNTRLPFESPFDELKIEHLLPHVDTTGLSYAEAKGLVVDPELHNPALASQLQREVYALIKEHLVDVDVLVGRLMPKNVKIAAHLASATPFANAIIREDKAVLVRGQPRVILMASSTPDFPLLSEEMKAAGIGTSPQDFIHGDHAQRPTAPQKRNYRSRSGPSRWS